MKKLVIFLLTVLTLQSCSFQPTIHNKNEDSTVTKSDNIFTAECIPFASDENIKAIDYYNDDFYCVISNNNKPSEITSVILDTNGNCDLEDVIKQNYYSIIDIVNVVDNNNYYILHSNPEQKYIISKYNSITKQEEDYIYLNNISDCESIWVNNNNIFLAYHTESKYMINIYDTSFNLLKCETIESVSDDDYIYDIRPLPNNKYGCFVYNDCNRFAILDSNFKSIAISDDKWEDYIFRYTIKDDDILVYEKNKDNDEYSIYEISADNSKTKLITDANLPNITEVFDGYGDYMFLFSAIDGLYGYNSQSNACENLYQTENYIVNASAHDNKIEVTEITKEDNYKLLKLKSNNLLNEVIPDNSEDLYVDDEGNRYYLCIDIEKQCFYIKKIYLSNDKVKEIEFGNSEEWLRSLCVNGNYICELLEDSENGDFSISFLNKDSGIEERKIQFKDFSLLENVDPFDIYYSKNNTYIATYDYLYIVDPDKNISKIELPSQNSEYKFIDSKSSSDIIISNLDGIYCYTNEQWTEILNWNNCDIDFYQKNYVFAESDSTIYVVGSTSSDMKPQLYKLSKNNDKSNKKIIRISGVDMGSDFCDYSERIQFFDFIRNQNNSSNNVKFIFNDYPDYESMQLDMLGDQKPDIVFLPFGEEFDSELLLDLTDYFKEKKISDKQYYTNLFGLNDKTKISTIPITYSITFMIGRESEIGKVKTMTLDKLLEIFKKDENNDAIYSEDLFTAINLSLGQNLNSYIDFSKKTSNLNTDEICELLNELKKRFPLTSPDDSESVELRFINKKCPIDFCTLALPEESSYWSDYLIGESPSLYGIPSCNNSSAIISPAYSIGIMSNSKYKEECLSLITDLLSDNYQDSVDFLPVKKSSLQKRLKESGTSRNVINKIDNLISDISVHTFTNTKINDVFYEEMDLFINNEKTASETLADLDKKITLYLNERY